jgi:methylated-DNA-[protein]-cysteine S-methyltransferase
VRPARFAAVSTPLGTLLCIRSGRGIARIAYPEEGPEQVLDEMTGVLGARPVRDAASLRPLEDELDAYFGGTLRRFRSTADLSAVAGFARLVLGAASLIPYGAVATYGELAARAGHPRAARAAGTAMRRNPVPLLVPCHRVVPADGTLGSYSGHEDRRAFLLKLEEVALQRTGRFAAHAR